MSAKSLRVVSQGEKPLKPAARLSVAEAAATGEHRALLISMRERIARAVSDPECPPRDLASLTRRLQDISKEIESLDLRDKEEGADSVGSAEDEEWSAQAL